MWVELKYTRPTLRTVLNTLFMLALLATACLLIVVSHQRPPRLVSPYMWPGIAIAAPGTSGAKAPVSIKPVIQGKLDERFVVSWPPGLRVGSPEDVIVRI